MDGLYKEGKNKKEEGSFAHLSWLSYREDKAKESLAW